MPSQHRLGLANQHHTLTLPSMYDPNDPNSPHNTCVVRKLAPAQMMAAGILDRLDSLTGLVQMDLASLSGRPTEAVRAIVSNKQDLQAAMDLVDRIVEAAVVDPSPVIRPVKRDEHGVPLEIDGHEIPLSFDERRDDVIYTDLVDLNDKNAIVAFVLQGVRQAESFRPGPEKPRRHPQSRETVQLPPVKRPRRR